EPGLLIEPVFLNEPGLKSRIKVSISYHILIRPTDILFPVKLRHIVFTGPDMVRYTFGHAGLINTRRFWRRESIFLIQFIGWSGIIPGEVFTFRIGPLVFHGAGNISWPGSHQSDEHMLMEGKGFFVVAVLIEIIVEPMGECLVDHSYCFSIFSFGQCGSTTS